LYDKGGRRERSVAIQEGTNTLAGATGKGILSAFDKFRKGKTQKGRIPEFWDGKAAERIVKILLGKGRDA
jgi:UDP-N-acetylglucosamine 2-epimerase (non-hydrolysing)